MLAVPGRGESHEAGVHGCDGCDGSLADRLRCEHGRRKDRNGRQHRLRRNGRRNRQRWNRRRWGELHANAACGGDIVGVWEFAATCTLDGPRPEGFCSEQTVVSQTSVTGTYTFRADGTATFDGTFSGTVNDVLPAACLVDPLTTCTALDADVKQRVAEPGSTYKSAACTAASSGGCACVWSFETTVTNSATYTTMGSTLTVTNTSSGATGTSSYCVQGSSLVISYPPSTPGGPPIIYVLTKR